MAIEQFHVTLADICKEHGLDEQQVKGLAKEVLAYRREYMVHPKHKLRFSSAGVTKLEARIAALGHVFSAAKEEYIWAKTARMQPKNPRRVYIVGPEIEGKGICPIPAKLSKIYRQAGKRVPVRHVKDNVYQIVVPAWRDDQETKTLGDK